MSDDFDESTESLKTHPFADQKESFASFVGFNLSKLTVVSLMQIRAMTDLTQAIKTDASVSDLTRKEADDALSRLMGALDEIEIVMESISQYFELSRRDGQ